MGRHGSPVGRPWFIVVLVHGPPMVYSAGPWVAHGPMLHSAGSWVRPLDLSWISDGSPMRL